MPKLTIDLSDEAYALLIERAQDGDASLEAQAVRLLESSLVTVLPEGIALRSAIRPHLATIKGFISTLLMDEDGTMFAHSDRREFFDIIDKECDSLKQCLEPVPRERQWEFTFRARPTRLRDVLEAVRDEALKSPFRKPTHKFILEVGDDLPATILTDAEALKTTLWTFLKQALELSPSGGEVHVQIRCEGPDGLFFSISDQERWLSPEFMAVLGREFSRPLLNIRYFGSPLWHQARLYIQWHGGMLETHSNGVGTGTMVSFMLRLFREDFAPINEDPRYYEMVAALRQSCLRLLAEAEQLPKIHLHFDGKARKALSESLQKEAETLQALVKSLQTITTPLVPQTDEPAPLGDQPP
ncbi:sensor histidine kinase [Armatimonas sp.]|uniref:sensor histidine kinase n=1 Tax=Armatimonas sp. TaxID=1872638 RepID=UPI00374C98FA